MYIIYCFPEPEKKIYLKNDSIKNVVLDNYKRIDLSKEIAFSFNIVFTEDVRKACTFVTREVALKCVEFLQSVIPEDFKIEVV